MTTFDIPDMTKSDLEDKSKHDLPLNVTYRLATLDDLPDIASLFGRMLTELASLGHDILPTPRNIVLYTDHVFAPALDRNDHGIVLALAGSTPIAATFFTPEQSAFDVPPGRVTTHGLYVDPEWRHSRIALNLIARARRHLRNLGYTTLINYILSANVRSNALARYYKSRPLGTQLSTPL